MASITGLAEVAAMQHNRGNGYYGSRTDKKVKSWSVFSSSVGDTSSHVSVIKTRYEYYVLSWILNNGKEPPAAELEEKHGETILRNVRKLLRSALELQEEPAKKKSRRKK